MTEGLAFEPAEPGRRPDVTVIGTVTDIDGDRISVGVVAGTVIVGTVTDIDGDRISVGVVAGTVIVGMPDDLLGLSYALDAGGVGELAKLLAYATWEAGRQGGSS